MFKRGLCFLTAAVFLLLLAPVPGHACEHYGPDTPKSKLVRKGYVEPQVGVPGYTGDYHCPVCDAIVIKGKPLAAADDPANSLVHPQETGLRRSCSDLLMPMVLLSSIRSER